MSPDFMTGSAPHMHPLRRTVASHRLPVAALLGDQFLLRARNRSTVCVLANSSLCLRGPSHDPLHFQQYDVERRLLNRWHAYPAACNASESSCLARADLLIAATPVHRLLQHPERWSRPRPPGTTYISPSTWRYTLPSMFVNFWRELSRAAKKGGRATVVVVHYSFPFDIPVNQEFLAALSRQPAWFQRRTVVACVESDLRADIRARLPALAAKLVAVPYATSAWHRPPLAARTGNAPRNKTLLLVGAPRNWLRAFLGSEMQGAGGACNRARSFCVVFEKKRHRAGARPTARGIRRWPRYRLWADELTSVFCAVPHGDTPTRSYFYVAAQAGCIPVIFDGAVGTHYRPDTSWAWRGDPRAPPIDSYAIRLDARNHSWLFAGHNLRHNPWTNESLSRRAARGRLLRVLDGISAARIRRMQTALDQYASATVYGDGSFVDAFSMLVGWLDREVHRRRLVGLSSVHQVSV